MYMYFPRSNVWAIDGVKTVVGVLAIGVIPPRERREPHTPYVPDLIHVVDEIYFELENVKKLNHCVIFLFSIPSHLPFVGTRSTAVQLGVVTTKDPRHACSPHTWRHHQRPVNS